MGGTGRRRLAGAIVAAAAALAIATAGTAAAQPAGGSDLTAAARVHTGWPALNRAIGAIPSYQPGSVRWVVSTAYDYWGTADWYHDVLYVSPEVPSGRLYDVAVHEWSHMLSVLDYGGDVRKAKHAMNRWFGGRGLVGAERAADCMAIVQGATWTHYTQCRSVPWRHGARRLVNGRRLPR